MKYDFYHVQKSNKKVVTFDDIEIRERKFQCDKNLFFLENIDIDNMIIPNKISLCDKNYKYFIGYMDHSRTFNNTNIKLVIKSFIQYQVQLQHNRLKNCTHFL